MREVVGDRGTSEVDCDRDDELATSSERESLNGKVVSDAPRLWTTV